ncbi:MAG: MlaD family protein [Gemmataceae bacterium]|nr:MlaD family protein [Gemmataceae bacterium]
MTRPVSRTTAVLAGLFVLLAVAGGAYGLFAVGDRQRLWAEKFTVHVGFETASGVGVGTGVRVRGLDAGAVTAVGLPATGRADTPVVLTMVLDGKFSRLLFADATARVKAEGLVGGRVIELAPGSPDKGALADGAIIASKPTADLNDVIEQAAGLVGDVKNGRGSLGKLIQDDGMYKEMTGTLAQTKQLMEKSQDAVAAIQQDAETLKKLPIIRGYVEDSVALLVRHTGSRERTVFPADALFEPGRAVLTEEGKVKLKELSPWLAERRGSGSDVVVAAFADPKAGLATQVAHTLTARQSEVVAEYLRDHAAAHKLGWWSRRPVKPIGFGGRPSPAPESEPLPPARVEVIVFTP